MKILFICTSAKDRSPALVKYFQEKYPKHEYRCAGVNNYFTFMEGTHYLTQQDIEWADLMVYAEDIHQHVVQKSFALPPRHKMISAVLNCGQYEPGTSAEHYLSRAESKLRGALVEVEE